MATQRPGVFADGGRRLQVRCIWVLAICPSHDYYLLLSMEFRTKREASIY